MKKSLVSKTLEFVNYPTYLLIMLCIGLIAGSLLSYSSLYFAIFLAMGALLLSCMRVKYASLFIFVSLGILLGAGHQFAINQPLNLACEEIKTISSGRRIGSKVIYKARNTQGNTFLVELDQKDLVYGSKIKSCFRIKEDFNKADQRYYLSLFRTKNLFEADDFEILEEGKGLRSDLSRLSNKMQAVSSQLYSGDEGALVFGVIFGSKGEFSSEFKSNLKKSGTSHLVAVSGYNVSIITTWFFESMRQVGKNFSGIFSVLLLAVFYFLTGGSASILRAGIMGLIVLLTKFIGRKIAPLHLLILAATVILLFNPFAIFDWGFQLSFMATSGLFFLAPSIQNFLETKIGLKGNLMKIFSETVSAQIFVLPILIGSFGQVSLVSPVTNLLILPLIPLLMGLVFMSIILNMVYPIFGIFIAGTAKPLLSYIIFLINMSSLLPFSSINISLPVSISLIVGYIIIACVTLLIRRKFGEGQV